MVLPMLIFIIDSHVLFVSLVVNIVKLEKDAITIVDHLFNQNQLYTRNYFEQLNIFLLFRLHCQEPQT